MTITLELPPETLAALQADAQAQGRAPEQVAAEHLAVMYTSGNDDLDTALEQAFQEMEAGSGQPLEQFSEELRTCFEARYTLKRAA